MRILHISCTTRHGAGKSLLRHHQSLVEAGIDSHILIADTSVKPTSRIHQIRDLESVRNSRVGGVKKLLDEVAERAEDYVGHLWFGKDASMKIVESDLFKSADVVELRQLHRGRQPGDFNFRMVAAICERKPTVWRLSDAWAFTGLCVYPLECEQWKSGCLRCPFLKEPEKTESRVPRWNCVGANFWAKRHYFSQKSLTVVSPSKWLLNLAKKSPILEKSGAFRFIPVGTDTSIFGRANRAEARLSLGIRMDEVVLAINAPDVDNYRKGADLLPDILECIDNLDATLLVIGKSVPKGIERYFTKVVTTGYIDSESLLAATYSAADIFLFTSRQDNSAQTLLEASASGLPTVCFDTGGNGEYVLHDRTGFAVPSFDCEAFAKAVEVLVVDQDLRNIMGTRAIKLINSHFSLHVQRDAFVELYKKMGE